MKTIYWIGGEGMGNGYVGCTSQSLKMRWSAHEHRAPRRAIQALAHVPDDDTTSEGKWIETMGTLRPNGKNATPHGRGDKDSVPTADFQQKGTEAARQLRLGNPTRSAEINRKISESNKRKWASLTPEQREERKARQKGLPWNQGNSGIV